MTLISTEYALPEIDPHTKKSDEVVVIFKTYGNKRRIVMIDRLVEGQNDYFGVFKIARLYGKVTHWVPIDVEKEERNKWLFDLTIQLRIHFPDILD